MSPSWPVGAEAVLRVVDAEGGLVDVVPPRKRVALVGFASSSRDDAPWHDSAWELWGMNDAYTHFQRRPDRWFELHLPDDRMSGVAAPAYDEDVRALGCPVYTVERDPTIATSVRYPIDRVRDAVPPLYRQYFTSTAAYMLALALTEGFETIALYGIDCTIGTEYEQQKPCVEAWCSLAMGRGVDVVIPTTSSLFKTPFLYGYEKPRAWPRVLRASESFLRDRIEGYKRLHNDQLEQVHKMEGAIGELTALLEFAESHGRGARFPLLDGTAP